MYLYHHNPPFDQIPCTTKSAFELSEEKSGKKKVVRFWTTFAISTVLFLCEVETVQVHHLGPGGHEIMHKFLLSIFACIHLSEGTQFRV